MLKLFELRIEESLRDVECERKYFPDVPIGQFIVLSHAVKHSLLIAQQPIGRQMIVDNVIFANFTES